MKSIRIGKEAAEEFEEAAAWYENEQEGLGERFIEAFEHALQLLAEENPPLTPVGGRGGLKGARKLILHKFPFSLIVHEVPASIVVIALAHHSRKPGYWRSRKAPERLRQGRPARREAAGWASLMAVLVMRLLKECTHANSLFYVEA